MIDAAWHGYGQAHGVVVATGTSTETGRIGTMVIFVAIDLEKAVWRRLGIVRM